MVEFRRRTAADAADVFSGSGDRACRSRACARGNSRRRTRSSRRSRPARPATNSVSVSTTASVRRVLTTCFLPFLILFPVAQALFDLEAQNNELKADLKDLYINGAQEVDISPSRQAVVIQVPFRLLKAFHKIQQGLIRELEKKFGKGVVLRGQRRINPVPKSGFARARPRSRTLTAVHANLLEDLVYPTGCRKRQRWAGWLSPPGVPRSQGSQHHGVQAGHLRGRVQENDR